MQPLKMVIPGEFWDSFIYKGRLYLFCTDGSVLTLKWDVLIDGWRIDPELEIAFKCAFQRSDYLYQSEVQDILRDDEVRPIISEKFERLARSALHVSPSMLEKASVGRQGMTVAFPYSDIDIYADQLFLAGRDGVFMARCDKRTKYPISTKIHKRWDAPVLSISASYGSLAIAAGADGLFEMLASSYAGFVSAEPKRISGTPCRDCGWAYYSLFASSDNSGYLAAYTKTDSRASRESVRDFEKLESASEIFGSEGYSWGIQDKLCQATGNVIKVVKYQPWQVEEGEKIQRIGQVLFDEWKGSIISASTANFGVIVELENALVIFPSAGRPITLREEPVNWRHFPKSRHYENQLHVIYEDRLEVLSFNHDYLVVQEEKLLGYTVFEGRRGERRTGISLS